MAREVLRRDAARAPRDQGEVSLASRRVEFPVPNARRAMCGRAPSCCIRSNSAASGAEGMWLAFELSDGVAEGGGEAS